MPSQFTGHATCATDFTLQALEYGLDSSGGRAYAMRANHEAQLALRAAHTADERRAAQHLVDMASEAYATSSPSSAGKTDRHTPPF